MRERADYKELNTERQWRSTTGLNKKQFESLSKEFEKSYVEIFGKTMQENQSNSTTDCAFTSPEDLLFFLLFCLKSGLTQDVLGFVFGIDGSGVSRNRKLGLRILNAALTKLGVMPNRKFEDLKDFETHLKNFPKLILDGTEQPVQRPIDNEEQKELYSGKKNAIQ